MKCAVGLRMLGRQAYILIEVEARYALKRNLLPPGDCQELPVDRRHRAASRKAEHAVWFLSHLVGKNAGRESTGGRGVLEHLDFHGHRYDRYNGGDQPQ